MNNFTEFDLHCMQRALLLAETAAKHDEVPVGAVLVNNGDQQIIGEGYNQPISSNDPTAHAEIIAMRQAANKMSNYRLVDTTLYVTLEPCAMCAGAMLHARIKRLIFATPDPRAGAVGGAIDLFDAAQWNHNVTCAHGLLAEPCAEILRQFFQARR
ncbi:MAG TPA: tRNA adenosine(34) deaminase TadA [Gammaproteobacteria bacterium]|nr:tRNA adenosine(34) deaminase TadA [Gammaproteobacteria bacterium]